MSITLYICINQWCSVKSELLSIFHKNSEIQVFWEGILRIPFLVLIFPSKSFESWRKKKMIKERKVTMKLRWKDRTLYIFLIAGLAPFVWLWTLRVPGLHLLRLCLRTSCFNCVCLEHRIIWLWKPMKRLFIRPSVNLHFKPHIGGVSLLH